MGEALCVNLDSLTISEQNKSAQIKNHLLGLDSPKPPHVPAVCVYLLTTMSSAKGLNMN